MPNLLSSANLCEVLQEEGFELPRECRDVRLVMDVDSALELHYVCFVTAEDLAKIGRALMHLGERQSDTIPSEEE